MDRTQYWVSSPIAELGKEVSQGATALMGHYLVVLVQGSGGKLYVVDLRDNSVQQDNSFLSVYRGDENYSFTKYGENQIIMFGGERFEEAANRMVWMTIESLNPIQIKFEVINDNNAPSLSGHTADIYQDCMYVFSGRNRGTDKFPSSRVWCFSLKERTWKLCETTRQAPSKLLGGYGFLRNTKIEAREGARSFIGEDSLYIYGGFSRRSKVQVNFKELWALNLKSMQWRKIEQKDPKPAQNSRFINRLSVDIYGDNMLILKNETEGGFDNLYCCNRHTLGSWSNIDVRGLEGIKMVGNSMIYKNLFYVCTTTDQARKRLALASFDLDSRRLGFHSLLLRYLGLGLVPPPMPAEGEELSALFLSDNESDIKFKVQDKVIPVQKKVLIEKSKFFSNLFNSGMMESRLEVIDIDDCEYEVFQEFLRFLYCGRIDQKFSKFDQLLALADKYIQEDLHDKCVNILVHRITPSSFCSILDFAREHDIFVLRDWCLKLFPNRINMKNITQVIKYIHDGKNSEHQNENERMGEMGVNFVLDNLAVILEDPNTTKEMLRLYADFLLPYVSVRRIFKYGQLFTAKNYGKGAPSWILSEEMAHLRDAIFDIAFLHYKDNQNFRWCFNSNFHSEYSKYQSKRIEEQKNLTAKQEVESGKMSIASEAKSINEDSNGVQRKAIKRMDPTNSTIEEEEEEGNGPTLKKTKQAVAI